MSTPANVIGHAVRSRLVHAADADPAGQAAVEALAEAGWIIDRRDDAAKVSELTVKLNEARADIVRLLGNQDHDKIAIRDARAEIARLHGHTSGHAEPCLMCGEPCNGYSGNPFLWPLRLGNNGWHHVGCVNNALHECGRLPAIVLEAVARSDSEAGFRDHAARWIADTLGIKVPPDNSDDTFDCRVEDTLRPRTTHPPPAEVAAEMSRAAGDWQSELSDMDLWLPNGVDYISARIWHVILAYAYDKSGDLACNIIARALTEYGDQRAREALEAAATAVEKYSPGTGHVVRALLTRPT